MNKYRTFLQRNEKAGLLIFFIVIILLYLPALFLCDVPDRDTAMRYAPAAEAFARGDWLFAFHPRMQMLHPFVSGIFVLLFPVDGFLAAKLSSLLFYAAGVIPFYFLMKEVFNGRIASWGMLFYPAASRLAAFSYSGLRETHKQFVILLLALGVVLIWKNRTGLKGHLCAGIACGLAVCTRNDLILFSAAVFFGCAVLDAWKNRFPWRSAVGFCTAFVFSLPEFFINRMISGYFLPGARFLRLFREVFHCDPTIWNVVLFGILPALSGLMIVPPAAAWLLKRKSGRILAGILLLSGVFLFCRNTFTEQFSCDWEMGSSFIRSLFKGTVPLLLAAALPGMLYRIFRKKMTGPEYLLLILYLTHGILIVLQIFGSDNYLYISARYLIPAAPLYFGWIWFTSMLVVRGLGKLRFFKRHLAGASVLLSTAYLACCFLDAYSAAAAPYIEKDEIAFRNESMEIAAIIRKDYDGARYTRMEVHPDIYFSNRLPRIFFKCRNAYTVSSYLAGGTAWHAEEGVTYTVCPAAFPPENNGEYRKVGDVPSLEYGSIQIWRKK